MRWRLILQILSHLHAHNFDRTLPTTIKIYCEVVKMHDADFFPPNFRGRLNPVAHHREEIHRQESRRTCLNSSPQRDPSGASWNCFINSDLTCFFQRLLKGPTGTDPTRNNTPRCPNASSRHTAMRDDTSIEPGTIMHCASVCRSGKFLPTSALLSCCAWMLHGASTMIISTRASLIS